MNAELKNGPEPRSKEGGVAVRESRVCTTAFQIQDAVTVVRMKRYSAFDFRGRENCGRSRIMPVRMLARAPTTAVRKDARARERTVK